MKQKCASFPEQLVILGDLQGSRVLDRTGPEQLSVHSHRTSDRRPVCASSRTYRNTGDCPSAADHILT